MESILSLFGFFVIILVTIHERMIVFGIGIQPFDDDDNIVTESDILKDSFLFRIRDPFDNVLIIQ